jgi:enterochelin esterase-like enzyme
MLEIRYGDVAYHPNPNPGRGVVDTAPRSCVYIPDAPTSRVLYLLHGVGDTEYSWEVHGRISALVELLVNSGTVTHSLIVMPFGFVTEDNKRNRRFPDPDAFDKYMLALIETIEGMYEAKKVLLAGPRERAIAGLSMGGKQALEFGFSHPETFKAVGSFSAAIQDRGQGQAVDGIVNLAVAGSVATQPRLYCSCGTEDEVTGLIAANQALAGALAAQKIGATVRWMPGKHEWAVWRRSVEEFLRFWSQPSSSEGADVVRRIVKVEPLPGKSCLEVVDQFAQRARFPHVHDLEWPFRAAPHYHTTVEELQVCRGSITFVDVRSGPQEGIPIRAGERIVIPEGTVHSAFVGRAGVEYVMGLTRNVPIQEFPVYLPVAADAPLSELVELVEANYAMAEAEEAGEKSKAFFEGLLSPRLVFVGARDDQPLNRAEFIDGLERRKAAGRRAHGLQLRREGSAIAATILVATADGAEYLNARLFERDASGRWVCVRWSNMKCERRPA